MSCEDFVFVCILTGFVVVGNWSWRKLDELTKSKSSRPSSSCKAQGKGGSLPQ